MLQKKFTSFMKDLVVLAYANNTCHTTLHNAEPNLPGGLEIDLDTCTWKFDNKTYQIGQMRQCEHGCRWGVIGVYDRQKIDHLNAMLHHSKDATAERMSFYDSEYA